MRVLGTMACGKYFKNVATIIPPTINKSEMLKRLQGIVKEKQKLLNSVLQSLITVMTLLTLAKCLHLK